MTHSEIRTANVTVPNGDLQIAAYLAQPAASGQFPAVIVIQEIFGINSHIREVTERIAKEGYVAIAPAIYQRQAPGFETGYTPKLSKSAENTKKKPQLPNFSAISKPPLITSKLYPLSNNKVLAASVSALEDTSPTSPLLCPKSRLQRRSTAPVSPL